jgi:hypothetical protein
MFEMYQPFADGVAFSHHATIILAPKNGRAHLTPLVRANFLDLSRLFVSSLLLRPTFSMFL